MIITSDDILGREAVDSDGDVLGTVVKLHVENTKKSIMGITVDQGFLSPDLFVGNDLIKRFGVDAVFLNRVPEQKYLGLPVISSKGEHIGKVKDVVKEDFKLTALKISKGFSLFRDRSITVPVSTVKEIGQSVVLKEGKAAYSGIAASAGDGKKKAG